MKSRIPAGSSDRSLGPAHRNSDSISAASSSSSALTNFVRSPYTTRLG